MTGTARPGPAPTPTADTDPGPAPTTHADPVHAPTADPHPGPVLRDEPPEFPMPRTAGCPFDPPRPLRELQEQGPLVRVRLSDGSTSWLVTRHAEQRTLLRDRRVSSDVTHPGYPGHTQGAGSAFSFIHLDDPEHARQRRMVTAPFSVKRVAAMRPAVQRITDELIDAMLAGPNPVDLVEAFALPVPSLVISELLGVPYEDHAFFQAESAAMIRWESPAEERAAAGDRLRAYLDTLMASKIADPGDDLLSELGERVEAGELTRQDAAQMGVLLLLAGHETTANMIALGTLALFRHPEQLALLRDGEDEALVASAAEELLRYLNITHSGRRRVALEDIEIAGRTVRAGEGLIMANDIGNRDPAVYSAPDSLDLRRNPRNHVAFGFGVHQCLGQQLARMELQVVYGTLYRRIPTLRPAVGLEEIPFKHDGAVYGVYRLPVTW